MPARRPSNPVMSQDRVKRILGVEMTHLKDQLRAFLASLSGAVNREC